MRYIYAMTSNNGDGSASVVWFNKLVDWDALIESDLERWSANEGGPEVYKFPEILDLEACGFGFYDPTEDLEKFSF